MKQFAIILATAFFTFLSCHCEENITPDCICYDIYKPVCGCDGVTYSNDCRAGCSGITDYTEGKCP